MDCSEAEKEVMTETIKAEREELKMTDNQESVVQEKGSREHQTDTLAGIDIQETTHKQGATTEKETTVMRGKEETMKKTEAKHMKGTATDQTTVATGLEIEKEGQETLQEETGEIRTKPERNTGLMRRETGKPLAPDMKEIEATQGTGITLDKETVQGTGMTPENTEKTTGKGMTQDQGKTIDLETTLDQRITLGTETIPETEKIQEQETAQTTTEEETENTQETSEAKAETETHGKQYPSTRET